MLYCKLSKAEVGIFNATVLVDGEFGRSLASTSTFYIAPDEKIYNYLSYAGLLFFIYLKKKDDFRKKVNLEITSISTNIGGSLGGTFLTINGRYFYSSDNQPADIRIGGNFYCY